MSLNGNVLSTLIFDAMAAADEKIAPVINGEKVPTDTPQKQRERQAQAKAIAVTIINLSLIHI